MSTAPSTAAGPAARASRDGLARLLAVENRPAWARGVQSPFGQAALAGLALLTTWSHFGPWAAGVAVIASLWAGQTLLRNAERHMLILFCATWGSVLAGTALGELDTAERVGSALSLVGLSAHRAPLWATLAVLLWGLTLTGLLAGVRRWPKSWPARHPLQALLALEAALCLAAWWATRGGAPAVLTASLWIALFVLTPYVWFLPYAVTDLRSRPNDPLLPQLALQRAYWSPTYLPFGKGLTFLRRHRAADANALAVTQLKGAKLLVWAQVLHALRDGLAWVFDGVPSVHEALEAHLAGQPVGMAMGWAALVLSTARFGLQVAVWAHLFIGVARLAGYRLPRGSWRPLESRTLMDYFNRFHYYFKEILVDFFFVPTFFRVFKSHPRLRMFFATFMAAGVGNALWHFLRDIDLVATLGPAQALQSYASYAFYCAVLATGIGLSQVRAQLGRKPPHGPLGRLWSFLVVWGFVVTLHVFSDGSRTHTLGERLRFLSSLFGV
ncbi:MAG TPA: hypothetical protein VFY35_10575 [Burkholderiaceae bacterium]|nr:hypothetical protein [Burkholderiaceae bacterium]